MKSKILFGLAATGVLAASVVCADPQSLPTTDVGASSQAQTTVAENNIAGTPTDPQLNNDAGMSSPVDGTNMAAASPNDMTPPANDDISADTATGDDY